MVYISETYELCHKLADNAKEAYQKLLEDATAEKLLKSLHPVKWILSKLKMKILEVFN